MTNHPHSRSHEALVLGLIWAVVGVIYSTIYVVMLAFLHHHQQDLEGIAVGLAASLAGAVGALFYGSLRLATLATLAALIATFGFLYALPYQAVSPVEILAVSGMAGLIVGGHYGYLMTDSRVCQATAKTLSGLYAGFIAGMPLAALTGFYGDPGPALSAGILTPLTGLVYILTLGRLLRMLKGHPPAILSGALVGGGVAGMMGLAVWAFVGIFNSTIFGDATEAVRFAWASFPDAATGGAVGGFLAGAMLGGLGVHLTEAVRPALGPAEAKDQD